MTSVRGRHTLRFGVDARRNITSELFVQRQRGDYNYSTLERFLLDLSPDIQAERNTGGGVYHGNNTDFYSYFSSETRIRPNITLTLGLRHEYKGRAVRRHSAMAECNLQRSGSVDFRRRAEGAETQVRSQGGIGLFARFRREDRHPRRIRPSVQRAAAFRYSRGPGRAWTRWHN